MNITSGLFSRMVFQRCCEGGHPVSGVCGGRGPVAARVVLGSKVVFAGAVGMAAAGRFSATLPVLAPRGPYELSFPRKKFWTLFDFSEKLAGWKKFLAENSLTNS